LGNLFLVMWLLLFGDFFMHLLLLMSFIMLWLLVLRILVTLRRTVVNLLMSGLDLGNSNGRLLFLGFFVMNFMLLSLFSGLFVLGFFCCLMMMIVSSSVRLFFEGGLLLFRGYCLFFDGDLLLGSLSLFLDGHLLFGGVGLLRRLLFMMMALFNGLMFRLFNLE
jgi:hypothetical protein